MRIDLTGRRALVTGSTSGMGFAIARGLADARAAVVVNGRHNDRVRAAIDRLRSEIPGATVDGIAADVGVADELEQLTAAVTDIDVLVSNAGPTDVTGFFDIPDEDWRRFVETYVMASVRLSRRYVRGMIDRGWGRVVFNGSVTGGFQPGEMVHWGTCKAAVLGLARGIAESVAGSGVTVNTFIPGPTHTKESFESRHPAERRTFEEVERDFFDGPLGTSLLKRFVNPREVANVVVFLASEQASAITGSTVRVDGGIIRSLV
jgi:NAD(P)-dependent dehydrogenase (short-subunit alcohol dehydrogenase family)